MIVQPTKSQKLTILVFSSSVFAEDIALLKSAIPWVSRFEAARTVSSVPVNLRISKSKKLANMKVWIKNYTIEWKKFRLNEDFSVESCMKLSALLTKLFDFISAHANLIWTQLLCAPYSAHTEELNWDPGTRNVAQYHVPNNTGLTFVHWWSSKFKVYKIQDPNRLLLFFLPSCP